MDSLFRSIFRSENVRNVLRPLLRILAVQRAKPIDISAKVHRLILRCHRSRNHHWRVSIGDLRQATDPRTDEHLLLRNAWRDRFLADGYTLKFCRSLLDQYVRLLSIVRATLRK